jgi:hypothetical protein
VRIVPSSVRGASARAAGWPVSEAAAAVRDRISVLFGAHPGVGVSRLMAEIAREVLLVSLEDEMRQSYLDYAMSVIVGRALPDVRDG